MEEITLTAQGMYMNPYTQVTVTATFTAPSGATRTVRGFWDGGNTFRVRYTPMEVGTYTYVIASNTGDPGLTQNGMLQVGSVTAGNHGFLRRDHQRRHHFRYDDNTRYFMFGQTYYEIIRNAWVGNTWKTAVDNSNGWLPSPVLVGALQRYQTDLRAATSA